MKNFFKTIKIRTKIILASVVVEVILLTVLVANSVSIMQTSLAKVTELRAAEIEKLLNITLANPLIQRDYATLQDRLDRLYSDESILYLVLEDDTNQIVAVSNNSQKLNSSLSEKPIVDQFIKHDSDIFRSKINISVADEHYGTLYYGLSTRLLTESRKNLIQQSVAIAFIEVILSVLILALVGLWLTRNLTKLTAATQTLGEGKEIAELPVAGEDEVSQLTKTFNEMAESIRQRIAQLKENEQKFSAIADYTYNWESWYSNEGELIWLNPSVERLTGFSVDECKTMDDFPYGIIHPEDRETFESLYLKPSGVDRKSIQFRVIRKNGSIFHAECDFQPIYDKNKQPLGVRSSIRDISAQREAQEELKCKVKELRDTQAKQKEILLISQQERARLKSLLAAMKIGVLFETNDKRIAYYNPTFKSLWMIESSITEGENTRHVLEASGLVKSGLIKDFTELFAEHDNLRSDLEIELNDNRILTIQSFSVRDSDKNIIGNLRLFEDVTEERQTEQKLLFLAERDSLTGLFNRRRFQEELNRELNKTARTQVGGALLLIDLDDFKIVNDSFGHGAGDLMLIRIAREVGALVRKTDVFCRMGGDEFAVIMPECSSGDAIALAERVISASTNIPFRFSGQNIKLTTSIGIAMYPEHGSTQELLISHADTAMYQAKDKGKNRWSVYHPDKDTSKEMADRLNWNARIDHAVKNNLFEVFFQGVYDTHSGVLTHIEALVRMIDDQNGSYIAPNEFIPIAESSGKIVDIDKWMIDKTLHMKKHNGMLVDIPVAVNISGRSFDEPDLHHYIANKLQEHDVQPSQLVIELTETSAVSDMHDAQIFISALQKIGCKVCLDDFGVGFSSFVYLKFLNADILKLDGYFIKNLPSDEANKIFVQAMVSVAQGLGKKTIAEFVEDQATFSLLKDFGIDMAQGFYLNIPSSNCPPKEIVIKHVDSEDVVN